jgi:hypothetical protein
MWTGVEDWVTQVISEFVLTQSNERHEHISLHYDAVKLLPASYHNAPEAFKQGAEAEVLLKTGYAVQIERKQKMFFEDHFSDLVGDAVWTSANRHLLSDGNCIPAGLAYLNHDRDAILKELAKSNGINKTAREEKGRSYMDCQSQSWRHDLRQHRGSAATAVRCSTSPAHQQV